jgi:hypothetical protein
MRTGHIAQPQWLNWPTVEFESATGKSETAHNRPGRPAKNHPSAYSTFVLKRAADDNALSTLTTPANTATMASTQSVQCFGKKRNATVSLPRPRPTDLECDKTMQLKGFAEVLTVVGNA